ncbi:MAG: MFS transporter [Fuerstiella sp.]|nr:MFS transporter [Fuerstiella sp.]
MESQEWDHLRDHDKLVPFVPPLLQYVLLRFVIRSSSLTGIILLVSVAHATVHLLEQSIASAELAVSADFDLTVAQSGWLGFALRLPYGIGAILAGLLADRFGEKRILVIYLLGAAAACFGFSAATHVGMVYILLVGLGTSASMYHPAGLSMLANATTPATRPRALGIHGIFGSLGIAFSPFLAGLVLRIGDGGWRDYYLLLGAASAVLGVVLLYRLKPTQRPVVKSTPSDPVDHPHRFQIIPYLLLVFSGAVGGLIYGGVLHFLPRYLSESGALQMLSESSAASAGNFAAAVALVFGAVGQWTAGRLAVARMLPLQLAVVFFSNAPALIWMARAEGGSRLAAAGVWAFFHFMSQPLYNALLAEFMSVGRRSFAYGFSNLMGFGIGAIGPIFVAAYADAPLGYTESYQALAAIAVIAGTIPLTLLSSRIAVREQERPM